MGFGLRQEEDSDLISLVQQLWCSWGVKALSPDCDKIGLISSMWPNTATLEMKCLSDGKKTSQYYLAKLNRLNLLTECLTLQEELAWGFHRFSCKLSGSSTHPLTKFTQWTWRVLHRRVFGFGVVCKCPHVHADISVFHPSKDGWTGMSFRQNT